MKILHIEAGRHLYGGAKQVQFLLEGLSKHGVINVLACPPGAHIATATQMHAQVVEIPMDGDLDFLMLWRIKKLIQSLDIDLVHVHSRRGADLWGPIAAHMARVPCVVSRRVDNLDPAWLARLKYRHVARVIAISEGIRRALLSLGLPQSQVCCVRSALDPTPYLRTYDKTSFKERLNLPPNSMVIGMVAQLIHRKGHRHLLAALSHVLKEFPQTQVLLYGRGPLESWISQEIIRKGLHQNIRMMGFQDDLPETLGCLDLLVHPADKEGLGIALLQASAAGVPIIASRAGGMPEVVHDGVNGALITPGDVPALTDAISTMLSDPEQRHCMGQAGRELVIREFSVNAMCKGNLAVYQSVLNT